MDRTLSSRSFLSTRELTSPGKQDVRTCMLARTHLLRGPIFFYCGNEGPIESFYDNTGFMFDIAPEFNAVVIFAGMCV